MSTISEYLTLDSNSPKKESITEDEYNKKIISWEDRKISLAIIEILSFMQTKLENIKYLLFLGGSSNDDNFQWTNLIQAIYPNIEIHIYSSNNKKEKEKEKEQETYTLHNKLFTDKDVKDWIDKKDNTLLIGMYNSGMYNSTKNDNERTEKELWNDMVKMRSWINSLDPIESLVYFRPPNFESKKEKEEKKREKEEKREEKNYIFLKGYLFLPIYDNYDSNYVWLKPEKYYGKYVQMNLNPNTWKYRMNYHNTVTKNKKFINPLVFGLEKSPIYEEAGLKNTYDNYAEVLILDKFFYQFSLQKERNVYIKAMIDSISKLLIIDDYNPLLQ